MEREMNLENSKVAFWSARLAIEPNKMSSAMLGFSVL